MSSGAPVDASSRTLVATLWPRATRDAGSAAGPVLRNRWLRGAVLVLLGTGLLTLSAKAQVPFVPVPMTLQTLVVLLLGAAYGWRLGAATVGAYLIEGAAGLPVFAGPMAGPAYLAGPTGGFLLGFLLAAAVVGVLAERGWNRTPARLVALMALGHLVIFAAGLAWLAQFAGFARAWTLGAEPFVLATLLKTALAAALLQAGWTFARR